jgi:hypothetical protein
VRCTQEGAVTADGDHEVEAFGAQVAVPGADLHRAHAELFEGLEHVLDGALVRVVRGAQPRDGRIAARHELAHVVVLPLLDEDAPGRAFREVGDGRPGSGSWHLGSELREPAQRELGLRVFDLARAASLERFVEWYGA